MWASDLHMHSHQHVLTALDTHTLKIKFLDGLHPRGPLDSYLPSPPPSHRALCPWVAPAQEESQLLAGLWMRKSQSIHSAFSAAVPAPPCVTASQLEVPQGAGLTVVARRYFST